MISKYRHKELAWVDLEAPSEEEILHVIEQYSIPLSIEEEIRTNTDDSKTTLNNGCIFTSLYFPQILLKENKVINNKISIIINNSFILTIHDKPVIAFKEFLNNLEIDTTLPEQLQIKHTDLLSFYLIKSLYISLKDQLLESESQTKEIESQIFESYNKNIPILVFNKNKILIEVEQILGSHNKILKTLSHHLVSIFGDRFENYSSVITEESNEVRLMVISQNKNLNNLYNLNNSIRENKNHKNIKLLVSLSVISLIIIMLISIYVFSNI
ncbi:MAG: hypothetical protein JJE53_00760 [Candidatus Pacebacteria bacterium]|nr:hypothetical protein [Candidatus Paceibacterota bacterium]